MITKIAAPLTTEAIPILQWIEVASSLQIPNFHIIGLPGPEVEEARERVRAAIEASGLEFPRKRIVLNLSPASIRKRGTGLDLAMALSLLCNQVVDQNPRHLVAWGELGLDGAIKSAGQMNRVLFATWSAQVPMLILAPSDYAIAMGILEDLRSTGQFIGVEPQLFVAESLAEAWQILNDSRPAPKQSKLNNFNLKECMKKNKISDLLPLHPSMERLLGVAAAGAHHLLLLGPRGTGKSHALDWLVALQPHLSPDLRLQNALIAELGTIPPKEPIRRLSVHTRPSALLGGASPGRIRPGEVSLAHGGLLVADEFLEWPRDSREGLREPLEKGTVTLTRVHGCLELPARFTLAASGNLCPCGGWPQKIPYPRDLSHRQKKPPRCICRPKDRHRYLSRLSGPILDRVDLVSIVLSAADRKIDLKPQQAMKLRDKVQTVRENAICRWKAPAGQIPSFDLEALLNSNPEWTKSLDAIEHQSLRARHKVARIALTLSLWDGAQEPTRTHFLEASFYRPESHGLAS